MLNSFQKWAIAYARPYGLTGKPRGNWIGLSRYGERFLEMECMSVEGVKAACESERQRRIVADYVAEGLGEI